MPRSIVSWGLDEKTDIGIMGSKGSQNLRENEGP